MGNVVLLSIKKVVPYVILIMVGTVIFSMAYYLWDNYHTVTSDKTNLGTLGDYIGGIMNPTLTFITISFLLYTIIQNKEIIKINSRELSNSTGVLSETKEIASNEYKANKIKLNIECIKTTTESFDNILNTNIRDADQPSTSLKNTIFKLFEYGGRIDDPEQLVLSHFLKDENPRFVYRKNIIILAKYFIENLNQIKEESPGKEFMYVSHIIPYTFRKLSLYAEHNKDTHLVSSVSDEIIDVHEKIEDIFNT
jgi:hypothetical protein